MDTEGNIIRKSLASHNHDKWGFVIYRCTYDNDDHWATFLNILETNTRRSLDFTGDGDLMDRLDWVIQEDPATLDGADKDEVRRYHSVLSPWPEPLLTTHRRFRAWVAASGVTSGITTRYAYCIHVDAASLDSIVKGPQPPARDIRAKTWVNVIDIQWVPADNQGDEDEADVDGCRMYDVGWMKVGVGSLAPRAYAVLEKIGWEGCYARPPKVAKP